MTTKELYERMCLRGTMLCVGLDSDPGRLPQGVGNVLDFNKAIIDATAPYCIAYKPNLAFYECGGAEGLRTLERTVDYLRSRYPDHFLIADAKRGDIGSTARMYARTYFETMDFDAVTLSPYMGRDTVEPFLAYPGKFAIVVALSSNPSAADFQYTLAGDKPLYQDVMEKMMALGTSENLMFVVGATRADRLLSIRSFCPDHFFLVPGVGAQGGSAEEVINYGANARGGLLINSSRAILYASSGTDFADAAAAAASRTAVFRAEDQMSRESQ